VRRVFPIAVAVLAGGTVLLDLLLAPAWLGRWPRLLLEAALVLGAFALLLGTAHLTVTHARRAVQREPQGVYGAVLVIALLVTFGIGVAAPRAPALSWVFRYLYTPLQATMLGLMTFVLALPGLWGSRWPCCWSGCWLPTRSRHCFPPCGIGSRPCRSPRVPEASCWALPWVRWRPACGSCSAPSTPTSRSKAAR
jgi:hypothetical protein